MALGGQNGGLSVQQNWFDCALPLTSRVITDKSLYPLGSSQENRSHS